MPTEEFVMRGQTASATEEILNFGMKDGYAFRLIEFQFWPGTGIGTGDNELLGSITAGKTAVAPTDPNFDDEGLIGVSAHNQHQNVAYGPFDGSVINDTFLITQNLILMVQDVAGAGRPVNWQLRFKPVKLSDTEAANVNYRQFSVFDE